MNLNQLNFEEQDEELDSDVSGKRVHPKLSEMVNYIKPSPMISLKNLNEIKYFLTVSSIGENTALYLSKTDASDFVTYFKFKIF